MTVSVAVISRRIQKGVIKLVFCGAEKEVTFNRTNDQTMQLSIGAKKSGLADWRRPTTKIFLSFVNFFSFLFFYKNPKSVFL